MKISKCTVEFGRRVFKRIGKLDMDNSILIEFRSESKEILKELEGVLELLEKDASSQGNTNLVQFSQRIDRIMGASQTIAMMLPDHPGLKEMGKIASLCKAMGYKAAEMDAPQLMPLFSAFWTDSVEVLSDIVDNLENAKEVERIVGDFVPSVRKRLEWLSAKIQITAPQEKMNSNELNDLLNTLFK